MRRLIVALFLVGAGLSFVQAQDRPSEPRSGKDFQSAETRALQDDETRNPGMLWVEQGQKLWNEPVGSSGKSCASCHGAAETSMKGVAARYPQVLGPLVVRGVPRFKREVAAEVFSLDARINDCRRNNQRAEPLAHESSGLLALSAFVAYQSRGLVRQSNTGAGHEDLVQRGHRLFHTRQGQLNLSCAQCHDDLVGKKLRGDTISQAQTHAWPAYRLEWQTMGSLQRRLRACSLGVRAEVLDYGHPDYLALEYYLAWRGEGLPMESPGVRR